MRGSSGRPRSEVVSPDVIRRGPFGIQAAKYVAPASACVLAFAHFTTAM